MRRGRRQARNRRYTERRRLARHPAIRSSVAIEQLDAQATRPSARPRSSPDDDRRTPAFPATPLDDAIRLQREGRNREAQRALRALLPAFARRAIARRWPARSRPSTDASLALGDYESAIQEAQEAFDVHQQLGQQADAAWDLNAVGLANLYLGRYDDALASYRAGAGARSRGRRRRRRNHPLEQHRQRPLHARPVCGRAPAVRGGAGGRRHADVRSAPARACGR